MLRVHDLTKRYGALTAIEHVTFEVRPGEVFGLLGPNGSGKSTTVKILMGLIEPTGGRVELDGREVLANLLEYKALLGYVPEEPHLYTYLTGPEYLQLVGRLRNIPDALLNEKIDRFLELLGIYDDRYQTLSTYSKGMRQKILIAAAVLHNPRIVILDEPFSGLDVSAARVLKAFVRSLAAEGKMVVFSSHVLEVVEQVCSRVAILKDGRMVGHDSVENLRQTLKLPDARCRLRHAGGRDQRRGPQPCARRGDAPAMNPPVPAFRILWRTFLEQFAANESATSDLQMRRAIIGVFAFLVTPGIYIMMSTVGSFEILRLVARARHMPELVETRLLQMAIVFVAYSMVTTGLITVFIWDTLVFDKRDAMVLGPLPVPGRTVVFAKLAALATFLLGAALLVNLTSGIPFGLVTGGNDGLIIRHTLGHFAGTIGGAVFIFSTLVIVRGLLVLLVGPQFAASIGSLLQFVFLSAVLCFMMVPTAMGDSTPAFLDKRAAEWLPLTWFVGLFERIRGSRAEGLDVFAGRALIALPLAVAGAVAVTFAGTGNRCARRSRHRRAWRRAPGCAAPWPVCSPAAIGRRAACLTSSSRRSRAANPSRCLWRSPASIAVGIISVAASTRRGGLEALFVPRTVVLWIPMVIGYWIIIGLRSSFAMPTELPAAWVFRVHSRMPSASYWLGLRAAMISFALLPALAVNALVVLPLVGFSVAAWHAVFVCIAVTFGAQAASITIDSVPFTRAYPPGHTKLKTRWPLYFGGMYAIAYWPVRWELGALHDPAALLRLAAVGVAAIVALDLIGRRAALDWKAQPEAEFDADPEQLTFLNLGPAAGSPVRSG